MASPLKGLTRAQIRARAAQRRAALEASRQQKKAARAASTASRAKKTADTTKEATKKKVIKQQKERVGTRRSAQAKIKKAKRGRVQ